MFRKQRGAFVFTGIAKLAVIGFIISLAAAFVTTIWSVYLEGFLGNPSLVGFFSAAMTVVSFISFFVIIPFIERSNKAKLYYWVILLSAIVYVVFAFISQLYLLVIFSLLITILVALRISVWGIIIKDKSGEKQISRNEGLVYTFINIAFLIGPLIAGLIAAKYGNSLIFIIAAILFFVGFVVFGVSRIRDANVQKKVDSNLIKNFYDFFKNKDRFVAYFLGGGVNLWWSLIYVFMPLYIIMNNLNEAWIGYFLFAVVIPLILLEYFFSKITGKRGFKKIFLIGFFIVAIASFICYFVSSNLILTLGVLVFASFGMAMVEPTTEAYFLDLLKNKRDECRFYSPYNTAIDVNYFIGELLSATILVFFPFKFLFLLYGFFMACLFFLSFKVKK